MHWGFQQTLPMMKLEEPSFRRTIGLDADRLKITGLGSWDAAKYVSEELWFPFVEPQVLERDRPVPERGLPKQEAEDRDEVRKLLLKWDTTIFSSSTPPMLSFRVAKERLRSSMHTRQIGDRRWQNAFEGGIPSPSRSWPTGAQICRLLIQPDHGVRICVTDRSDFYHQMSCTVERARSNLIWPPRAKAAPRKVDRTVFGDELAGPFFP